MSEILLPLARRDGRPYPVRGCVWSEAQSLPPAGASGEGKITFARSVGRFFPSRRLHFSGEKAGVPGMISFMQLIMVA